MANNGWIKLHRKIIDHWVFTDDAVFKIWVYLLLNANHEDKKKMIGGELIDICTGQTLTSIRKISAETGCSRYKVNRTLEALKKDSMISLKKVQHGTVLTVNNYKAFQRISGGGSATDCTTDCTNDCATDYTTDLANDLANDLAADLTQTRSKECIKNDKEPKKPAPRYDEFGDEIE